jgi:hypothetical protein
MTFKVLAMAHLYGACGWQLSWDNGITTAAKPLLVRGPVTVLGGSADWRELDMSACRVGLVASMQASLDSFFRSSDVTERSGLHTLSSPVLPVDNSGVSYREQP